MKFKILMMMGIIAICGCGSFHYATEDITGTYAQEKEDGVDPYINLTIDKTGFALVDVADYKKRHHDNGRYMCCDTIAYGTWKLDNQHGLLSLSTPQLSGTYIKRFVQEETIPNTDSVYFFITNPIEKNMGKKHQYISYAIDLYAIGDFGNNLTENQYNTNKIVATNPKHNRIQSFSIMTYIKPEYYARNIAINPVITVPYTVKDKGANSFKIDISELTFKYMIYLRLNERLIKIVNKNELILDGIKYTRK